MDGVMLVEALAPRPLTLGQLRGMPGAMYPTMADAAADAKTQGLVDVSNATDPVVSLTSKGHLLARILDAQAKLDRSP